MTQKIVFFDIDGTLSNEETHEIPSSTIEAIKLLQKNGHLAFINTGRPISEITDNHRSLNFDGYICGCGTYVELNNDILLYKPLSVQLCKEVVQALHNYNLEGILEGKDGVYFDKYENITSQEILNIIELHKAEGFYKGTTWHEDNIIFDKFVIFLNNKSNFEGFYKNFKDVFDFIKRHDSFYEIVPKGYSKATGIEYLINKLNIDIKNTFAIGDSTNDLTMLEYVENSIAMGNSSKELFPLVSYITSDIDDNGIYNALKHYNLI